jgi:hypothetical protein
MSYEKAMSWLPCDICGGDGTVLTDNAPREWVRDRWPTLECHPCHGVGFLPSPAVLEAMAEVLHAVGGPRPKLREAYPGPVIPIDSL